MLPIQVAKYFLVNGTILLKKQAGIVQISDIAFILNLRAHARMSMLARGAKKMETLKIQHMLFLNGCNAP
jgi:hypothetical protein